MIAPVCRQNKHSLRVALEGLARVFSSSKSGNPRFPTDPSTQVSVAELRERDQRDRTRAVSPLVPAPDALIIDSTPLSEDEVLQEIEEAVNPKLRR